MRVKDLPKPIRDFVIKYLWFRPALIYAYSCLDLEKSTSTRIVRNLWAYIGQTRQELASRHAQHMGYDSRFSTKGQPWADLYPEVRVIWQGRCPDFVLDFIEMYYIKRYKPLYNYIHNTRNPNRIPKHLATKQRNDRDRLARMRRPW